MLGRPPLTRSAALQVRPVNSGTATLKDATSEAIRDWVTNVETTHYILGSAAGPHPYPAMVRDFQAVIGRETRAQCMDKFGGKPDILIACIGGGSNAIGLFHEFVEDEDVRLIGACRPLSHPRLLTSTCLRAQAEADDAVRAAVLRLWHRYIIIRQPEVVTPLNVAERCK